MKALRVATLLLCPLIAAFIAFAGDGYLYGAGVALAVVWIVLALAVTSQLVPDGSWEHLDLLTATGRTTMWSSTGAMALALVTGWASFSVLGLLGLGLTCLAATWTALSAGGDKPWRRASVRREILPALCTEGDPIREEIRLAGIKIPTGMRLFVVGRATRHGAITRYAVGSDGSYAEVELASELGVAQRGEHAVPPVALCVGDVLGLTRTPIVRHGETRFVVLPRPSTVEHVNALMADGGDDAHSRPTHWLPTEGTFRIREYVPGDDMRRIHWVRSLQTNQLVVRLPDEIPPAEPRVRIILDTHLRGTEAMTCRGPSELLDVLVRLWLGIGKSLAASGTQVTLVTAAPRGDSFARVERALHPHTPREALHLGARVTWQDALTVPALLGRGGARDIVVSSRPKPDESSSDIAWVVVPERLWTTPEMWPMSLASTGYRLPFPAGSAENRIGRRQAERKRIEILLHHRARFSQMLCWIDWRSLAGEYVARPRGGRVALEVIS